jgi:hypothetical protein
MFFWSQKCLAINRFTLKQRNPKKLPWQEITGIAFLEKSVGKKSHIVVRRDCGVKALAGRALFFGKACSQTADRFGLEASLVCLFLSHSREHRDLSSIGPGLHELAEAVKTVPGEVRAELQAQSLVYQRGFLDGVLSAGVVIGLLLAAAYLFGQGRGKPSPLGERGS